jgi:hypothetical protein
MVGFHSILMSIWNRAGDLCVLRGGVDGTEWQSSQIGMKVGKCGYP